MRDTRVPGREGAARSPDHGRWMELAAEEYDRLVRMLRGLDEAQWQAPTDCDGWSVRDIAAHLSGAAAATASVRELVRQALRARRLGSQGDLVDRMNTVQIQERRAMAPAALVEELAANGAKGVRARRRLPASVRALPMPFGPPLGTRPLGYLMDRIYTRDAWMHRIDLSRATGAALEVTAEHDGAIVEDVVAEWTASHGAAVDLTLTGPAGGRWRTGADRPDDAEPVTIRMDAIELARILSGRAPGEGLLAHPVPF